MLCCYCGLRLIKGDTVKDVEGYYHSKCFTETRYIISKLNEELRKQKDLNSK